MALHFSRLKTAMAYFEETDSLTIESFLDLMVDMYTDVNNGIGFGSEGCVCDDSDALAANLSWLGTIFQQLCRAYARDLSQSNASDLEQLSRIAEGVNREIESLQKEKEACEKQQEHIATLEKKKRELNSDISLLKQNIPELKNLENRILLLEADKEREEKKWENARSAQKKLTDDIDGIRSRIKTINDEIDSNLIPQQNSLTRELTACQQNFNDLSGKIQSDDKQIQRLREQIADLSRDIEKSDTPSILHHLTEKKTELENEKHAIEQAREDILRYEEQILKMKGERADKETEREEKQRAWKQTEQDLKDLEKEFESLCTSEAQYARQKRRYHSLKASADQLRKDSALLCKRTAMEPFTLEEELDRAMGSISNYLASVARAIDKYSQQAEDCL